MISILYLVRKSKVKDNLSIKASIEYIKVQGCVLENNLVFDLKNVTSAKEIRFVDKLTSEEQGLSVGNLKINVVYVAKNSSFDKIFPITKPGLYKI